MIGDNFFNKTLKNLEENPRICILCYDSETKRSYQIKGSVKVHKSGPEFDQMKSLGAWGEPQDARKILCHGQGRGSLRLHLGPWCRQENLQ